MHTNVTDGKKLFKQFKKILKLLLTIDEIRLFFIYQMFVVNTYL